jgi:hypothetical protein
VQAKCNWPDSLVMRDYIPQNAVDHLIQILYAIEQTKVMAAANPKGPRDAFMMASIIINAPRPLPYDWL